VTSLDFSAHGLPDLVRLNGRFHQWTASSDERLRLLGGMDLSRGHDVAVTFQGLLVYSVANDFVDPTFREPTAEDALLQPDLVVLRAGPALVPRRHPLPLVVWEADTQEHGPITMYAVCERVTVVEEFVPAP
jgi:hypothetical protein